MINGSKKSITIVICVICYEGNQRSAFYVKKHDLSQTSKGIKIVQFKGRKSSAWGKPRQTVGGGPRAAANALRGIKP